MLTYPLPDCSWCHPVDYVCLGGGGWGGLTLTPSGTRVSAVIPVSPSRSARATPTNTTSRNAPGGVTVRILPVKAMIAPPVPTSLTYVGSWPPPLLDFRVLSGSRFARHWLINLIRLSLSWPCSGACECAQYGMHHPSEWKCKHISLMSSAKGQQSFSWRAADINYLNLSIAHSCGSNPLLCTESPSPIPKHVMFLIISDFLCPNSFGAGWSTQNGVVGSHFPLSVLFCSDPDLARFPNSTFSISVLLQ